MRAFEEALHALKHIKSFQENQLWRKKQCESFSKLELQLQKFQVGGMKWYKPTVLSVPSMKEHWIAAFQPVVSGADILKIDAKTFSNFQLHAKKLYLEIMEVDITASLKNLITVCFWMNNE